MDSAEYNVSVWGSHQANAAVLGISTMTYDAFSDIHDRLCTFEAKWDPKSVPYQRIPAVCPAPVPPELKDEIERVSIAAFIASGCRDYGRIDLRLKNGHPMVLDVNANCDVSPDGGFANAAQAAGLSYGQMMEQIVRFAWQRAVASGARTGSGRPDHGAQPVAAQHARRVGDGMILMASTSVASGEQPAPAELRVAPSTPDDRRDIYNLILNSGIFGQADADCVDGMFAEAMSKPSEDGYRFLSCWSDTPTQDQLIGFACVGRESLTKDTWDLFWICVDRVARGRGAGRALMEEAQRLAISEGGRLMVIYTSSTEPYRRRAPLVRSRSILPPLPWSPTITPKATICGFIRRDCGRINAREIE